MSDQTKINDSNENEDMVDEVVEDFTMVHNENDEVEFTEDDTEDTEVEEVPVKIADENSGNKPGFFASCAATISDAIIIGVLSFILMYIVDFIMQKTVGLYVVEKGQMLFLLYVIVSLLYVSILESRLGFTVGKTVFGIKVVRN
ncbi:MAG: RDD family protein [Clostridiaceae bacterium]|nr:RDD family protein [Clostridiaceae bacterium]